PTHLQPCGRGQWTAPRRLPRRADRRRRDRQDRRRLPCPGVNSYLTNIEANGAEFREVRGSYFPNKQALPASTLVQVPRLANPAFLLEIEAVAILPPKA